MAHIDVHRIEAIAARRLARLHQVAALAPFPARAPHDPWSPWRSGYRHATPAAVGGRLGTIYLGSEIPSAEPGGEATIRPPAAERAPRLGATGAGVPEQLSYVLAVRGAPASNTYSCASTPPLPWPCQIVGASVHASENSVLGAGAWGLLLTDDDYTGIDLLPAGTPLALLVETDVATGAFDNFSDHITPIPVATGNPATQQTRQEPATQLLGTLITTAGKRLTFCVATNNDAEISYTLVLTLRSIAGVQAPMTFAPRAAPAPRAPATRAQPARALPRQQPPPPIVQGGWILPPTGITPIFGVAAETRPTSPPSQAVALQMIWAGRAPVTVPFRVGPGDTAIAAGTPGFESLRQAEARRALERAQPLISTTF